MPEIKVEKLTKRFGPVLAVDELDITFHEGEITCLLGPSGCGKTTLLRIIAGLEEPTGGRVFFGGKDVTRLPPRKRNMGMVFQYPVVYRGISVYENIELPLKTKKLTPAERKQRVEEVMDILDLGDMADRLQEDLDNVTRQKVAVARAVAYRPDIIMFDEPMTNIDANSKIQFKHAFKALTQKLNQVIVYVTHDQTEAMTFADRIALMDEGRIVQCESPRRLYNDPADSFGGWFLGNPGMNFIPARCGGANGARTLESGIFNRPLKVEGLEGEADPTLGVRPEHIRLSSQPTDDSVAAEVLRKSITIGGQYLFTLEVDGVQFKAKAPPEQGLSLKGRQVWLEIPLNKVRLFNERNERIEALVSAL